MEILISLQSGGNLIHDCGFMDVGDHRLLGSAGTLR